MRLWESVQQQVAGMIAVRDEVHNLQIQVEDLKVRFDQLSHSVLSHKCSLEELPAQEALLAEDSQHCRVTIEAFLGALPLRVDFVSLFSVFFFRRRRCVSHVVCLSLRQNMRMASIRGVSTVIPGKL